MAISLACNARVSGTIFTEASACPLQTGRLIVDPALRRRPGGNGRVLLRARLGIEFCAERSVATWTESIQPGER